MVRSVLTVALAVASSALAATTAPIPLTAKPSSSRVGGPSVVISIEVADYDPSELRCASSVGKTLGPIAVGPNRYACRLTPPPSGPDQVAIVVVYSDRMDGPVGTTFVTIRGRGNADYPRALLITRPAILPADKVAQSEVNLFALDRSGQPFGAEFSKLTVSGGRLGPVRPAGIGRAVAMLTAPSEGDGIEIEARLPDGGTKVNARTRLTLTAAPPARVAIVGPSTPPMPGEAVTVQVTLSSVGGGPAAGVLALRTDTGRTLSPIEVGVGAFTATFLAPSPVPASKSVTVLAVVDPVPGVPGKSLQATLRIPVGPQPVVAKSKPPPPPKPAKAAPKGELRAVFDSKITVRGHHSKRVSFSLVDEDGDKWTPDGVAVSTDVGKVSGVWRDGSDFVADYEAPDLESASAELVATVGGRRVPGGATVRVESRGTGPTALGVSGSLLVGGLINLGPVAAPDVELVGMYRLPRLKNLRIGGMVGFVPGGAQVAPGLPEARVASMAVGVTARGVPIAVRGEWSLPFGEADLYGGLATGLMIVTGSAPASGGTETAFVSAAWYWAAFAGVAYPLGPGFVQGELRWSGARFGYDSDSEGLQVMGNLGGPALLIGYQMDF